MNLFNSSKNNLDELVFEQRNKAYGAYAIRKAYPDHVNKSMIITLSPMLITLLGAFIWNYFHPIKIQDFIQPSIPVVKPPITDAIELGGGFTIMLENADAGFRIVVDKKVQPVVKKKEVVKPIENPNHAVLPSGINLPNLPNLGTMGLIGSGGIGGNTGGVGISGGGEPTIIEFTAEVMPEFPGGTDAMYKYIRENLNYPRVAIDNSVEGKVMISFVIMPDGKVQMGNIEKGIGFGCDEEALRVVNNMPTWKPAEQNGRNVPIRMFLPFVFKTVE
jgi:periplasmic protein TonB